MDVSVIVATFGDDPVWQDRARVAVASAAAQISPAREVIHQHGPSLHEARNAGAARAAGEWLCFVDADDALDPSYLDVMAAHEPVADLLAPAVRYVFEGGKEVQRAQLPKVAGHIHACTGACLTEGNWLVVGSLVRKTMFEQVGGFEPWDFYEDWALWLRCHLAGATVAAVPDAVYVATHRFGSRNKAPRHAQKEAMHRAIHTAILGVPA